MKTQDAQLGLSGSEEIINQTKWSCEKSNDGFIVHSTWETGVANMPMIDIIKVGCDGRIIKADY